MMIDGEMSEHNEIFGRGRRESWTVATAEVNGMYVDTLTNNLTSETKMLRMYPVPARETLVGKMRAYFGL